MEDKQWAIYDGTLSPLAQPRVPVSSRGLMYGDGCFETLRVYPGGIFKLEEHSRRLKEGLDFLGIVCPEILMSGHILDAIHDLLDANNLLGKDAVIRIQIWREGGRGYTTASESEAHYSIMATSCNVQFSSTRLATVPTPRTPDSVIPSKYKLSNGLNYIMASRQAHTVGADDALMQTIDGWLSETTMANIFWLKGHSVYTPSPDCDLLPGITRGILINLIQKQSYLTLKIDKYRLDDLSGAEAIWICNSIRELVTVTSVNERNYPEMHPVVNELAQAFSIYRDRHMQQL